ncbi:hypothetical protein RBD99_002760 [Salmonella enterica]|nr:hypothetical protein [Salmonella enterica]
MQYILFMRQGNASTAEFQTLIASLFAAAATQKIQPLHEALIAIDTLNKNIRWGLQERNSSELTISNQARPVGEELQFIINIDFQPYELIFTMPEFAAGTNRQIIGHVLCIDGDYRLYKPFDPRIMRRAKGNLNRIWGLDLYAAKEDRGVSIKPFLERDTNAHVESHDLQPSVEVHSMHGAAYSILIHQLVAKVRKTHSDYALSDLVRVTVGNNPVLVEVDSTHIEEE